VLWVSVLLVFSSTVHVNLKLWRDNHHTDMGRLLSPFNQSSVQDYSQSENPLLELLHHARIGLERKEIDDLPKWNEVVQRFGGSPRILGLETCSSFRQINPNKELRLIAPAGIFNSGTNLLYHLLAKNCRPSPSNKFSFSGTGIDWQVNWGKQYLFCCVGQSTNRRSVCKGCSNIMLISWLPY
jgi:hypothetical protein